MPSVWETRFAVALKRLAGLRESTALELLPDLMPTLPLADAASVDQLLLRGERLCRGWSTAGAVAGQFSRVQLLNATAGTIVTVRRATILVPAANGVRMVLAQSYVGGAAASTLGFSDNRIAAAATQLPTSQIIPSASVGIMSGQSLWYSWVPANVPVYDLPVNVVLTPDPSASCLAFEVQAVNSAVTVAFEWTERNAQDELLRMA